MTDKIRIALGQLKPVVGDLKGNADKALKARAEASKAGTDLIVLPELFSCGYIPEDLLYRKSFLDDNDAQIERIKEATNDGGPGIVIGTPYRDIDGNLYNAVVYMKDGAVRAVRYKFHLVTDGVFDEQRWFKPAKFEADNFVNFDPINVNGVNITFPICHDLWASDSVTSWGARHGADFMISINASPYCDNRLNDRYEVVRKRVAGCGKLLVYLNTVHCIDELILDGGSFAMAPGNDLPVMQMPQFEESLRVFDFVRDGAGKWSMKAADKKGMFATIPDKIEADYRASVMGLREYVTNNGFGDKGVVLGLSGGIDSAVVAMIATDALGADKVDCIMLPYKYTSDDSLKDAKELAANLGVRYEVVPIEQPVSGVMDAVGHWLDPDNPGVTEENIQARIRAVVILAKSNKTGSLMLNTSCFDECAVGFATYLADANGGWAVTKNVPKLQMYEFARWRNANYPEGMLGPKSGPIVPANIITRPPSAELAPGQQDSDSLPDYADLGRMLECLVTDNMSVSETAAKTGLPKEEIAKVENRIFINEFKRRQSPVGPRILRANSFSKERRLPISNVWRSS